MKTIAMTVENAATVLFWALYPIPTLVAWLRHARHAPAITAIDYLAGWTIVGWIAALVWAVRDSEAETSDQPTGGRGRINELIGALLVWILAGGVAYFVFVFLAVAGGGMDTFPGYFDSSIVAGFVIMIWVPAVLVVRSSIERWRHGRSPFPLAH